MTGTRGSHIELKRELHLCSAAHPNAATVIDGSKVLVFTPHRLTRSSSMTPSSLYLLPSVMYYTTNRTFARFFSKSGSFCMQLRPGSYALTFPSPLSSSSYAIFGGDAVFVHIFCNSIPKSVRISNFLGMRWTKLLNSFAVCPLPFLYGKSTRNVV